MIMFAFANLPDGRHEHTLNKKRDEIENTYYRSLRANRH